LTFFTKKIYWQIEEDLKARMELDELNQFGLLEQKVEFIISLVSSLKEEKVNMEKNLRSQEEKIDSLTREIEVLKADRDLVRKRIATLLERIEEFNLSH